MGSDQITGCGGEIKRELGMVALAFAKATEMGRQTHLLNTSSTTSMCGELTGSGRGMPACSEGEENVNEGS